MRTAKLMPHWLSRATALGSLWLAGCASSPPLAVHPCCNESASAITSWLGNKNLRRRSRQPAYRRRPPGAQAGSSAVDAALQCRWCYPGEPQSVASVAVLLHFDGKHTQAFDGRETAPAGTTPALFLDGEQAVKFIDAVVSGRSWRAWHDAHAGAGRSNT